MSLPVIAIVVASLSALFTGVNTVISYRAFRRVPPKVTVQIWPKSS